MKWQRRLLKGLAIHVAIASVIRRMERRLYQSWKSKKRKEKQQQKCFLLVSTGVGESWSATITLIGWSEPVTNSDWTDSSSNHLSFLVAPFPDGCDDKPSDTSGLQIFFFPRSHVIFSDCQSKQQDRPFPHGTAPKCLFSFVSEMTMSKPEVDVMWHEGFNESLKLWHDALIIHLTLSTSLGPLINYQIILRTVF